jgi:hypothetical protein
VKGHEFGFDFSSEDRKALMAFLRTLGEVEPPLSEYLEFNLETRVERIRDAQKLECRRLAEKRGVSTR